MPTPGELAEYAYLHMDTKWEQIMTYNAEEDAYEFRSIFYDDKMSLMIRFTLRDHAELIDPDTHDFREGVEETDIFEGDRLEATCEQVIDGDIEMEGEGYVVIQ